MKSQKWVSITIIACSVVIFVALLLEAYRENLGMDWQKYQRQYRNALIEAASDQTLKDVAGQYQIKLRQIVLPDSDSVDRCISCHVGIETPSMSDKPNPIKSHPGDILDNHEIERFGCTSCHLGQGRAISTSAAHGEEEFWHYPIVDAMSRKGIEPEQGPEISASALLQSSCYQCHNGPDLFDLPKIGADVLAAGVELFIDKGCLSCHQINGIGASNGVNLDRIGDRPLSEYDFSSFPEDMEKTVFNWHFQHLKNPKTVVPTTIMPFRSFTKEELRSLVVFVLSLKEDAIKPLLKFSRESLAGAEAYGAFCAGCHGTTGQGKAMATSLSNEILLQSVSEQFWRAAIVNGRSGTRSMPGFTFENTGLFPAEVDAILEFVGHWQEDVSTDVPRNLDLNASRIQGSLEEGNAIFHRNESCASCHGDNGVGSDKAAQLNNRDFLELASDSYIKATVLSDRMRIPNMPSEEEIHHVIAYIRSWQPDK